MVKLSNTQIANSNRSRAKIFDAIPEVAPRIYTATGPILFKDAVALAMPWRLGFIYGRELAAVVLKRRIPLRTSFAQRLSADKAEETLQNCQQAMIASIAMMETTSRVKFLGALCDFINDVDDATGHELLLSSLIETVWAFCDDQLASYAERTWLKYVPNGGLAKRDGIVAFNAVNCTLEFFDPKDVAAFNLDQQVRIRPNGEVIKLSRYGQVAGRSVGTQGAAQQGNSQRGTLGTDRTHGGFGSYDGPGAGIGRADENQMDGPGQGSSYGSHTEGSFDSYGGPGAGTGRPDEYQTHGPGERGGFGSRPDQGIGSYTGVGAGIGQASPELRGQGQGATYGQPRKKNGMEAYDGPGANSIGRTGSGMGSEVLSGPFARGKSPAEQASDKDQRYGDATTEKYTGVGGIFAGAGVVAGAILVGGTAGFIAGAIGVGVMIMGVGLTVDGVLRQNINEKPDAPNHGSAGGPGNGEEKTPVIIKGGSMPNPDDPNGNNPHASSESSGMPNPDDPTGGRNPHANVYYPAPDDVGGGGPNSRAAEFPSSRDYYPAPDGEGDVGPRAAGVRLVPVAFAFGDGLKASTRSTGPKSARIAF
jgi:hypothetical protein